MLPTNPPRQAQEKPAALSELVTLPMATQQKPIGVGPDHSHVEALATRSDVKGVWSKMPPFLGEYYRGWDHSANMR